jgi:hypothetical protein
VLYADLARAVRRESAQAVAYWWGVGLTAVWKWRKALGVGPATEGTSRLHREGAHAPAVVQGLKKAQAKAQDPARRAKIAATLRGQPKPAHVGRAVAKAHRGTHHTEEARAKMSATHKRRGTLVPGTRVWTPKEDALVRRLPRNEAALRTGLSWADRHKGRTGAWPHLNAGPVADAPGETWRGLNRALWGGHRGLPGGSSLARLLAERRGRRRSAAWAGRRRC